MKHGNDVYKKSTEGSESNKSTLGESSRQAVCIANKKAETKSTLRAEPTPPAVYGGNDNPGTTSRSNFICCTP